MVIRRRRMIGDVLLLKSMSCLRPLNPGFRPAMPFQPEDFSIGFVIAVGWLLLVILASVGYRRIKSKPLFRPRFEYPRFLETWCSGHSCRSVITRLGAARNCLWVAVDENSLRVGPHFPFNLMFLPEVFGMEYNVPGDAVRSVERIGGLLTPKRLRISVERQPGSEESFEVSLRDPDAFVRAVDAIRQVR